MSYFKQAALLSIIGVAIWKKNQLAEIFRELGPSWTTLHPEVQRRAKLVIAEANEKFEPYGYRVGVFEGYRSPDRQADLMQKGYSQTADELSSYHVWGLAVDIVFLTKNGNWTWEPGIKPAWYDVTEWLSDESKYPWQVLGEIGKKHGFEWGGDFRGFFDGAHFQLPVMRISELKNTYAQPVNYLEQFA